MSERDKGGLPPVINGIFAVVAVCVVVFGTFNEGRKLGEQEGRQDANSNLYAKHAEQEITERCIPLSDTAQAECIRGVIESTNEHDRDERDLVAQSKMAVWAFWMFIVSGFSASLTGLGVWYVKRTLDKADETNAAAVNAANAANRANEIAREAQRPWVKISATPIGKLVFEEKLAHLTFKIEFENVGKTPALAFAHVEDIYNVKGYGDGRIDEKWEETRKKLLSYPKKRALLPGETLRFEHQVVWRYNTFIDILDGGDTGSWYAFLGLLIGFSFGWDDNQEFVRVFGKIMPKNGGMLRASNGIGSDAEYFSYDASDMLVWDGIHKSQE